MKIYGIVHKVDQCYGHGDYGSQLYVGRTGAYGAGEFPPFFKTFPEAVAHIASLPSWERIGRQVQEFELVD